MNTATYINWLLDQTGNQKTPTEMLAYVNIAQNEIFSYNTYFNRKKPVNTMLLATTDGIKQYTLADKNIRQVAKVYMNEAYGTDSGYTCDPYYDTNEVDIAVEVEESLDTDTAVTIYFEENPGTTTDKYYLEAYTWPKNGQLTSMSVSLSVPEKVQTGLLYYSVAILLELDMDGRSISFRDLKKEALADWFTFANQGAKRESNTPTPKGY